VNALERVSRKYGINNEILTLHALVRNGRVATIITPHIKSSGLNGSVLLHPWYDFGIFTDCVSDLETALNVSEYAIPELGDGLIAYGYGVSASVWKGTMSRVARTPGASNCSQTNASHWTGETRLCDGDLIAQGHQHEGMSGAAVLNGCGYVGTAHAALIRPENKLANFALIIPAKAILDFIDLRSKDLPTLQKCNMQVTTPPVAVHVDCSSRLMPDCQIGSCDNPTA